VIGRETETENTERGIGIETRTERAIEIEIETRQSEAGTEIEIETRQSEAGTEIEIGLGVVTRAESKTVFFLLDQKNKSVTIVNKSLHERQGCQLFRHTHKNSHTASTILEASSSFRL
jgi:hypothetical protein